MADDKNIVSNDFYGDLDLPADLFNLRAIATTGTEFSVETNELPFIPVEQLPALKEKYNEQAKEHFKLCKYSTYNLWTRFNCALTTQLRP